VGRGGGKSYCLLVPDTEDHAENERLKAMVESNDGFYLAEKDLEQRGPGDFLGTRQAGFNGLQLASMTNVKLIEQARNEAHQLVERDPDMQQPEHARIAESLSRFWNGGGDVS
jgi:ATP-dependent DNA helicase RecG